MPPSLVLPWIAKLRWVAVWGQLAALALAIRFAPEAARYATIAALVALTAASNVALEWRLRSAQQAEPRLAGGILAFDTLLLTTMLAVSGGPDNPFAVLYVIHIAMAAVMGGGRWAWSVAVLAVGAYAAQFRWHIDAHVWHQTLAVPGVAEPVKFHLAGMWVAVVLVAVVTTYFVQEIINSLGAHEAALREAQQRLARTERLASLTTLAAGAAHELGSPLATVAVVARELERSAGEDGQGELAREASLIRDEVDRCREILERMSVGLQRDLAGGAASASIDDAVARVQDELGDEAKRVEWHTKPSALCGLGAAELAQLILPLVRNGLDAGAAGRPVEVRLAEREGVLRVEVTDSGEGMPASVLERSVEPFFTTKAPGSGTGLGLHIVRVVSEAMGGQLLLDSTPGQGTRVTLTLPTLGSVADEPSWPTHVG